MFNFKVSLVLLCFCFNHCHNLIPDKWNTDSISLTGCSLDRKAEQSFCFINLAYIFFPFDIKINSVVRPRSVEWMREKKSPIWEEEEKHCGASICRWIFSVCRISLVPSVNQKMCCFVKKKIKRKWTYENELISWWSLKRWAQKSWDKELNVSRLSYFIVKGRVSRCFCWFSAEFCIPS